MANTTALTLPSTYFICIRLFASTYCQGGPEDYKFSSQHQCWPVVLDMSFEVLDEDEQRTTEKYDGHPSITQAYMLCSGDLRSIS